MALSDRIVKMSKGKMEQVGQPFEIYNYPGTPFVADQLPPGKGGGSGTVRVGSAVLRTTTEIEACAGEPVTLMMRPEELEIGDREENPVKARRFHQ